MKTDTIFYRLFQSFPSIFFELLEQPPESANAYQFSSVEVKQLAFRIDGVFLPLENAPETPIYFAEVQFQPDKTFYSRFFAEIFLYLDKTELTNDWRGVVIYPSRNTESSNIFRYRELLTPTRVRRIYLDELGTTKQSIGIETVKLVIEPEETAASFARHLIEKAREEVSNEVQQRELLQLIETIIIYKFTQKSREEIQAMLGLGDIRQTRVYQEAKEEGLIEGEIRGKLKTVPYMLSLGATVDQIAEALNLSVEEVRQAAQQQSSN
ncbi:Rpn family recombination-promoting nuclease/putative transposase [Aerosakkonemataceae cyanobacterium BLCC-F50]|uniref:Rpn family recombination-promoting nuclease/putative transposase n=1 Tax=Floridaenema flaviceps BLCC-F50 TaxID=3153642 RepID=A0ABV4XRL4_9CYAN